MNRGMGTAGLVFAITLALTFCAAIVARFRAARSGEEEDLAGRKLNRWVIGISAGTTGNSGFIVTGAVGLGYAGGLHWIMLPLSWMLGDLVFWYFFPNRLNKLAREAKAVTLSEMLTFGLHGRSATLISIFVAVLLAAFLSTYTAAQWLAGKKFLSGIFELTDMSALLLFAATIVVYSAIGGFRGSVYTDVFQGAIRIAGTIIALAVVTWYAVHGGQAFHENISKAGPDFLSFFPNATLVSVLGFVGGYACASIGFGLGQPQVVSRYLAGRSPEETRAAWWIYIGFVQFTWIAMTSFGVLLRGVMPGIADPETGLSLFFQNNIGAVMTGIIFADVYATIASTSNGILVAISQTIRRDIIAKISGSVPASKGGMMMTVLFLGIVTIGLSMVLPGNVFSLAIGAVSKIGAGIAGPVVIKIMGWRHSAFSLLLSIVAGISAAFAWTYMGYDAIFNEAGIGLAVSLLVNSALAPFGRHAPHLAASK